MKFIQVSDVDGRKRFMNPMCITYINTTLEFDDGYYYSVIYTIGCGTICLFRSTEKYQADDFTQNFVLMVEEALTQV